MLVVYEFLFDSESMFNKKITCIFNIQFECWNGFKTKAIYSEVQILKMYTFNKYA